MLEVDEGALPFVTNATIVKWRLRRLARAVLTTAGHHAGDRHSDRSRLTDRNLVPFDTK